MVRPPGCEAPESRQPITRSGDPHNPQTYHGTERSVHDETAATLVRTRQYRSLEATRHHSTSDTSLAPASAGALIDIASGPSGQGSADRSNEHLYQARALHRAAGTETPSLPDRYFYSSWNLRTTPTQQPSGNTPHTWSLTIHHPKPSQWCRTSVTLYDTTRHHPTQQGLLSGIPLTASIKCSIESRISICRKAHGKHHSGKGRNHLGKLGQTTSSIQGPEHHLSKAEPQTRTGNNTIADRTRGRTTRLTSAWTETLRIRCPSGGRPVQDNRRYNRHTQLCVRGQTPS